MKRKPLTPEQKERKKQKRKENRKRENELQNLRRLNKKPPTDEEIKRKKEYNKIYAQKHTEKILALTKKYRTENKDLINKKQREKRNSSTLLQVKQKTRNLINKSFKNYYIKKSSRTEEILGCSFSEFKEYLESKFEHWMNWENRGLYNGELNYGWDIDHIIPMCSALTEEDVIKLNHYTNLQPLCGYINRHIKWNNIK